MRPNRDRVDVALASISASIDYGVISKDDVRVLLAALRAPTDEEIAEAWCRYMNHAELPFCAGSLRLVKDSDRLSFRDGIRHFMGRPEQ